MFTWRFWRETSERAIKSGAQAVILALGASEVLDLFAMDFMLLLGAAGAGGLLSVLTSLTTIRVGATGSPSAID
jgi:hypothetical protein